MIISDGCLRILRECEGLDESDTSMDSELLSRRPIANLRAIVSCKTGHPNLADMFLLWADGVGMKVDVNPWAEMVDE